MSQDSPQAVAVTAVAQQQQDKHENGSENEEDAPPTRESVLQLVQDKEAMERKLAALTASLKLDRSASLVDKDGFPVADLDIYTERHTRHDIVCLRNDHAALMKKIETGLHQLHAQSRPVPSTTTAAAAPALASSSSSSSSSGEGEGEGEGLNQRPFAEYNPDFKRAAASSSSSFSGEKINAYAFKPIYEVDEVSASSPAAGAGVQVGDLILAFGGVNFSNVSPASMRDEVGGNVGQALKVIVRRKMGPIEATLTLSLTPQRWAGQGLLGMHIVKPKN
jgi:26S proteasome non-ATPase regulatory subunit 9